ncbi:MAG: histidine phosphatase family protein [Burkholderiaceae bacterium]|jgi:probable phosphoglycerate mutase|nr:histidine phosphatase family protein [Burkholderiaceae bacterium]
MDDTTRLIAIRHGETDWNVNGRIQGQLDIELNPRGLWQALRAGQALEHEPIAAVYASDLRRAWQTALEIARHTGAPVYPETRLRERAFGCFEGRIFTEIEAEHPEAARLWRQRDPHFAPPGGESLFDFRARITAVAQDLAARHAGQQIVLVAHGGVMDVLYRSATQQELQTPRTWALGNAAINRLLWTPQGLALVGWGDDRHLEGDAAALDEPKIGN